MAGPSRLSDPVPADPYSPAFAASGSDLLYCNGDQYKKLYEFETVSLGVITVARLPFHIEAQRVNATDPSHKDLILTVKCNKNGLDPHWRCSFTVSADCEFNSDGEKHTNEKSMTATRGENSLMLTLTRFPDVFDSQTNLQFFLIITMNSWSGVYPALANSFYDKTDITDATLIVEGYEMHVSRSILALQSTYFYNLFFNKNFTDADKTVYEIEDVEFMEMELFLGLLYPEGTFKEQKPIDRVDSMEKMLVLAERFGSDPVKRKMEILLDAEPSTSIRRVTPARQLLLSDKYRLSVACSNALRKFRSDDAILKLGASEEYKELSDSIKAALLDLRVAPSTINSDDTPSERASRRLGRSLELDLFPDQRSACGHSSCSMGGRCSRSLYPPMPGGGFGVPSASDRSQWNPFGIGTSIRLPKATDPLTRSDLRDDLFKLSRIAYPAGVSSSEPDTAAAYLQSLSMVQYHRIPSDVRGSLHTTLNRVVRFGQISASRTRMAEALRAFLADVESVKSALGVASNDDTAGPSTKKRRNA